MMIAFIALMMEAVRTSETSVYFESTRHYISEGFRRFSLNQCLESINETICNCLNTRKLERNCRGLFVCTAAVFAREEETSVRILVSNHLKC
jgi:hypothetical protein